VQEEEITRPIGEVGELGFREQFVTGGVEKFSRRFGRVERVVDGGGRAYLGIG